MQTYIHSKICSSVLTLDIWYSILDTQYSEQQYLSRTYHRLKSIRQMCQTATDSWTKQLNSWYKQHLAVLTTINREKSKNFNKTRIFITSTQNVGSNKYKRHPRQGVATEFRRFRDIVSELHEILRTHNPTNSRPMFDSNTSDFCVFYFNEWHFTNNFNGKNWHFLMHVSIFCRQGEITIELYWKHAPNTCRNFAELVRRGYYNNVTFHRIIRDFMIQGGDPSEY